MKSLDAFKDQEIVMTTKLDGENTSMYSNYLHARSLDSPHHPSRDWIKSFHSTIKHNIPEGWRVCGENVFARHSIHYKDLETYFYGFSIWNDKNIALSWDETLEYFELLGIIPVPVIYRGVFDEKKIKSLWTPELKEKHEGYVIRVAGEIEYNNFSTKVAKFVRQNHVQNKDIHWRTAPIVKNELK